MTQLNLTAQDGYTQAWFVDPAGQLHGGASAVNQSLRYVWWLKPLTYLYPLPGIRQLQDHLYRWVANNRYNLPGATPACKIKNPKKETRD